MFDATFVLKLAGRITDKTSVIFRRRLRRVSDSALNRSKPGTPASSSKDQTNKDTKLANQPKNGNNAVETTAPPQTKSSSRKPGTPAPSLTQESSPDQTNKETNLENQPKNGDNDGTKVKLSQGEGEPSVETTESPSQPLDVGSGKFDGFPSQPEEGTNVRELI